MDRTINSASASDENLKHLRRVACLLVLRDVCQPSDEKGWYTSPKLHVYRGRFSALA